MDIKALPAKLTAPRLATVLPRERLFATLDRYRRHGMIWVSGPPGSGKTALVSSYVETHRPHCLWYRVDEDDGDVAGLFYYLSQALSVAATAIKEALPVWNTQSGMSLSRFSRRYFRALGECFTEPFVVVFDDFHQVDNEAELHEALTVGLAELPPSALGIVISRAKPAPRWVPLQAKDSLVLIDWQDLQLTEAETEAVARHRGKTDLSPEMLTQLHTRIQGWMAGLVLMLAHDGTMEQLLPEQPLPDFIPETIFDYFAEEIWQTTASHNREMLMQSALLPEVSTAGLTALGCDTQAIRVVEALHKRNYFTSRISQGEYRYHPLFQDFLLARLKRSRDSKQRAVLQRRAAQFLLSIEQVEGAARLFKAAQDWEPLAQLVCERASDLLAQGRHRLLIEWLTALPGERFEEQPWLSYWFGSSLFPFDPKQARSHFVAALAGFRRQTLPNITPVYLALASILDTLWLERNDCHPMDDWIVVVEELLGQHPTFPSQQIEARITASMIFALFYRQPQHPALEQWVDRGMALLHQDIDELAWVPLTFIVCNYFRWKGCCVQARAVCDSIRFRKALEAYPSPNALLLKVIDCITHWQTGCYESAKAIIDKGLQYSRDQELSLLEKELMFYNIAIALSYGDTLGAGRLLTEIQPLINPAVRTESSLYHILMTSHALQEDRATTALEHAHSVSQLTDQIGGEFFVPFLHMMLADILWSLDRREQSQNHRKQFQASSSGINSPLLDIIGGFYDARVALAEGRAAASHRYLRDAFGIAHAQGMFGFLWWQPAIMSVLCGEALRNGIEVDYVQTLIRRNRLLPEHLDRHLEQWPWPINILSLGPFTAVVAGEPLRTSGKAKHRLIKLLKVLLALGGRQVHQDRLAEILWPDVDGDTGRSNLQSSLHRLRKLLGGHESLILHDGLLSLNEQYCRLDIWALEDLQREIVEALKNDVTSTQLSVLTERVFDLYGGTFLSSEPDQPWLVLPREALRQQFLQLVGSIAHYYETHGTLDDAADCYRRALDRERFSDSLYQRLMQVYCQQQRYGEAVAVYSHCCEALATLGMTPSVQTETLYRKCLTNSELTVKSK